MLAPRMNRSLLPVLALVWIAAACGNGSTGESTIDQCSNGRDDDADGLIDCADPACRVFAFCASGDAGPPDAGPVDAAPLPDGAVCVRPIDVVLTVDVSSSMDAELAALRDASPALLARLRALDPTARVSLVVFVDDALAVRDCAPLEGEGELASELEAWRARVSENRSPVSGIANVDCPENSLDALSLAVTACAWRDVAARVVVHVTDDTFAERPTVLSGPFGGGIVVQHTFAETSDMLGMAGIRVLAITRAGMGESCGAGRSPDVGQGFHAPYMGIPSLPERTGGAALLLPGLADGSLDVAAAIGDLAQSACEP